MVPVGLYKPAGYQQKLMHFFFYIYIYIYISHFLVTSETTDFSVFCLTPTQCHTPWINLARLHSCRKAFFHLVHQGEGEVGWRELLTRRGTSRRQWSGTGFRLAPEWREWHRPAREEKSGKHVKTLSLIHHLLAQREGTEAQLSDWLTLRWLCACIFQ